MQIVCERVIIFSDLLIIQNDPQWIIYTNTSCSAASSHQFVAACASFVWTNKSCGLISASRLAENRVAG